MLGNLKVKQKFSILTSIVVGVLIVFAVVVNGIIGSVKINGELYSKINNTKDLLADILPPPEYIIESYLTVLQSLDSTQNSEDLIKKMETLEKDFDDRKDYWDKTLDNKDELKKIIVEENYKTGKDFFDIVNKEWKSAVKSKDMQTIQTLAYGVLKEKYNTHRVVIDKLVPLSIDKSKQLELEANKTLDSGYMVLLIVSIVAIVCSILVAYVIAVSIIKSIDSVKNGMLEFFDYLSFKTSTINKIDLSTNDEFGQMANIINENISNTQQSIEQQTRLVKNSIEVANTISNGDLTKRIVQNSTNPALNELKNVINSMIDGLEKNIGKDINEIIKVLEDFSHYNFVPTINDTQGKVSNIINQMGEMITKMLIENKRNGLLLEIDSNTLAKNVETLNTSANQQAASLEETAASLEEMTSNIQNSTQKAQDMKIMSENTLKSANDGKILATKTAKAMEDINNSTSAINEAITIIDQIAFQTNILSLNAAVEAATAGESGKGFAVVAQEVRNLANRSSEAANSIKNLVSEATIKTAEGKTISLEMIKGYDELSKIISENTVLIEDVANASKEQLIGINQINDAIGQLENATQENARIANETNDIAYQTNEISKLVVNDTNSKEFRGKDNIIV